MASPAVSHPAVAGVWPCFVVDIDMDERYIDLINVDNIWSEAHHGAMETATATIAPQGLKNVIVADTKLGDVRGLEGFYHYRQYSAPELAATRSFEDVWHLLFEGELPNAAQRRRFQNEIAALRPLPEPLLALLPSISSSAKVPLASLRTALSQLAAIEDMPATYDADPITIRANAMRLCAAAPVLIA